MKTRNVSYVFALLSLLILLPSSNVYAQETGGDIDWLPDGKLNYTYVWPGGSSERWSLHGRSTYELTLSVQEKVYLDFKFTYVVSEDADIRIWVFNKMPISIFQTEGQLKGWLFQFDYANPPTSSTGRIEPINDGPFAGAGYEWSQHMRRGDQLMITGRLVMVNETATSLSEKGLAFGCARLFYSNSYLPVADFVLYRNQTLIPAIDLWGALGIPITKSTLDTIRIMRQQEASFNQEKANLQSQVSNLQRNLSSLQRQVETLQSDLKSAQDSIKSLQTDKTTIQEKASSLEKDNSALKTQVSNLEKDKSSLQSDVSSKQLRIDSLKSQLSQSQIMFYGSTGAAVILLAVAVVLAVRRRK